MIKKEVDDTCKIEDTVEINDTWGIDGLRLIDDTGES